MNPYSVSVSTTVPAAPAAVHDLLDDLSAHRQWTDHFLVDWELIGDPHGVGAKARFRAKGAGPHARGEIEVISSTPTKIVEEGRGGKDFARRTRGTYELAPAEDGGTHVTFTSDVWPSSRIDALGAPIAKAYLRRNNAKAMERLRQLLADRTPVAG
jgi:Polyketide cyclase / dehydrase and lipid transport